MPARHSMLQKAFREKNKELSAQAHSSEAIKAAISAPEIHQSSGRYLKDAVYGALDGMVTTFAVVAGVSGANLSLPVILILGFANLFADGFSMAAGNFLAKKSEQDYKTEEEARERWEIENFPQGEIEEIRQIYRKRGFEGEDLERVVTVITSDKERWLKTMMVEELGFMPDQVSPLNASLVTFFSFVLWGLLPLLTYILIYFFPQLSHKTFLISSILTASGIFIAGSLRSFFIAKRWWIAGFEMLIVGGAAALVAYGIGYFLRGIS